MSSVVFNPPVKTSTKRKRMPGVNKNASDEVKKAACFITTSTLNNIYQLFDFSNIYGAYGIDGSIIYRGSWMPIEILHPTIGYNAWNRIGNSYFIKYFRFKGYVCVKANNPHPIHWRFKLIRVEDEGVFTLPDGNNSLDVINKYLSVMYRSPTLLANGDNLEQKAAKLAQNYFCNLKTNLENKTIHAKVIASGTIPANNIPIRYGEKSPNVPNTAYEGYNSNAFGIEPRAYAYSKFDVRVLVNDNIGYHYLTASDNQRYTVSDVDYFVVLETDSPIGYDFYGPNSGIQGTNLEGGVLNSETHADEIFKFRISNIQYFLDP